MSEEKAVSLQGTDQQCNIQTQYSAAPSTPFDGLLLKDPRLMHLEVQGCGSWGAEGRDVLAGGVIGLAAILR